uniref:Uncharacterized protein n=2 Tax=Helicotheca tamesis TaxID=374047 RepID=A0A7S2MSQ6_9STRA|mmetsp:Transcript_2802/g.3850  ORF Transcript_2802/g.3850 Transcript_2802/m.3850 type:complete len:1210 (+) Transcript_2802:45-3674(+)
MATSYQKVPNGNGSSENIGDVGSGGKKYLPLIGVVIVIVAGILVAHHSRDIVGEPTSASATVSVDGGETKLFDEFDRYVLQDYDSRPTFAGFLPAIAGLYGKPVWSFYVNRGQGIASFGTESKEYPILEFNAANKAYQLTPFIGFRSFVQGTRGDTSFSTEPFAPSKSRIPGGPDEDGKPKRIQYIGNNEMEVKEIDSVNGLTTSAKYVVLPEEDFGALLRRTTFTNTGSDTLTLSALDGLAKMEPCGGQLDWGLKNMGRTLEGWMGVYHADDTLSMPFYRMSTEPSDTASVKIETNGHYAISFIEDEDNDASLLPIVYDTSKVFGENTPLEHPAGLLASSVADILSSPQYGDAKTSSAFAAVDSYELAPGESVTIASFYGKTDHIKKVLSIATTVTAKNYVQSKYARARSLMDQITSSVETNTANHLFNGAIKQMYMDNGLRGGLPNILGDVDEETKMSNADEDPRLKVYHTYSRIHGDLERDYNAFMIDPTYYSQGPGNYRDVAQNRRNDVIFFPRMGAFDIKMFLSYIQADAYEPLTVEAMAYLIEDPAVAQEVADKVCADEQSGKVLTAILTGGTFRPGQLFALNAQLNITLKVDDDAFINEVMAAASSTAMAVYGSGYWADHWEYYLDLIESYLSIYPDGEEELMYENELRYFFSTATVRPRSEKYVLDFSFDGKSKHVLQLDATFFDDEKVSEQEAFRNANTGLLGNDAYWQRIADGGQAFKSTPIAKLFLLGTIKFATRDAYGMGVEYEGGRPGWNDAMNGLPGMVGSGMPETYEMYLTLKYVKKVVDTYQRSLVIPIELSNLVGRIEDALSELLETGYTDPEELPADVPEELFNYWDVVAAAREDYRNDVQYYFNGTTVELEAEDVSTMLAGWIDQVELGMARARVIASRGVDDDGTSGVPPSYFSYNVTKWVKNGGKNEKGLPLVNAKAMRVGTFPLFLEGPVRYLKTVEDKEVKADMYDKVMASGLRDTKLNMYFLSANLEGQSYDMGRMMAFAPGWLENQSIWMHMSYKYYLELIRGKLYDQFFSEMRGGGMLPFMDPDVYGRSLMECSSFLASSAFPDPATQGRGFSARLSGTTAEFLSIWTLMFVGPKPFFLDDDGSLKMQLVPAVPSWLFEDEEDDAPGTYDDDGNLVISFKLFRSITVTYHNSEGKNLYGISPNGYKITKEDGEIVHVEGPVIPTEEAVAIRKVFGIASIDAYF